MYSVQEKQLVDRELLSELIESPVNPALFNMIQQLIGGLDPPLYLRINGEALWEWRRLNQQSQVFDAHQFNLQKIGDYALNFLNTHNNGLLLGSVLITDATIRNVIE